MKSDPPVSVIIPVYESQLTLSTSLHLLLAQDFRDFVLVVVDSSPSDECEKIIRSDFPTVRYIRSNERLLPHDARNQGVDHCDSEVLVFTDPDVYPETDWLNKLIAADPGTGDIVVGSVVCYGDRWLDRGVHLSKFDMWLPGGEQRWIDISPTVNMLCHRSTFRKIGGFPPDHMIGDTLFSWLVLDAGFKILSAPEAVIAHHHVTTWADMLMERWERGAEFGALRLEAQKWGLLRTAWQLTLSLLPLRWLRLMLRIGNNAVRAGLARDFLLTLPVTMTGQAAWLLGESRAYIARLFKPG